MPIYTEANQNLSSVKSKSPNPLAIAVSGPECPLGTLRQLQDVESRMRGGPPAERDPRNQRSTIELYLEGQWHFRSLQACFDKITRRALTDALTNIFNARAFHETLSARFSTVLTKNVPLAIAYADVDDFKGHNCQGGLVNHAVGDAILKTAGYIFRSSVRRSDFACWFRRGGDEFVLALANTSLEVAEERIKKIVQRIASRRLFYDGTRLPKVTISVGLAASPNHGNTIGDLLTAAALGLALAKSRQKGDVVVAPIPERKPGE